jgi:hypothetical protein
MSEPLDYEAPPNVGRTRDKRLSRALVTSGIEHLLIFLFASIMLDNGQSQSICLAVSGGYWAAVALILLRRSKRLTRLDLAFVAFGYPALVLPIVIAFGW